MIILDNQAINFREIFGIRYCLNFLILLCMIVTVLGIKIWWFRHRSSFEQEAKEKESTVERGMDVTSPLIAPRKKNKRIFSNDKRYSLQISQSAAEIQGIFRLRQTEDSDTQNNPTKSLPVHARKLSESAPSLFLPKEKENKRTIDSANNALQMTRLQRAANLHTDNECEKAETLREEIPKNFKENQLNEDFDILKGATHRQRISNPLLKFAESRKSSEVNATSIDHLKEKSLSNVTQSRQFYAKSMQQIIAKSLRKFSLINLNKTKTNYQIKTLNEKEKKNGKEPKGDITENSIVSSNLFSNTMDGINDDYLNHSTSFRENCSESEEYAICSSVLHENHLKFTNYQKVAEICQNKKLNSNYLTARHVASENHSNCSDENDFVMDFGNIAIKTRRPIDYEPYEIENFAISRNRDQPNDYSKPSTDNIRNLKKNTLLEIVDSEDFLNFELEKKSLSDLTLKKSQSNGCSEKKSSKKSKKSKTQHVAFQNLEEFDINRKNRNSALSKRRPTGLSEEENLQNLRDKSLTNFSFDLTQNSLDSKNLSHEEHSQNSALQYPSIHHYQANKHNSILESTSLNPFGGINYAKFNSNSPMLNKDNSNYDDHYQWEKLEENIHEDFVKNIEEEFSKIRRSYEHNRNNFPYSEAASQIQEPVGFGKIIDEDLDSFKKLHQQSIEKNVEEKKKKTKDIRSSILKECNINNATNDKNKLRKSKVTFDMDDDEHDIEYDSKESTKSVLQQTRLSLIKLNYNEEPDDSWSAIEKYRNLTEEFRYDDVKGNNKYITKPKIISVDILSKSDYRNPLAQLKHEHAYKDKLQVKDMKLGFTKSIMTPHNALKRHQEAINLQSRYYVNASSEA